VIALERVYKKLINQRNLRSWSGQQKECVSKFVTNSRSHRVCGEDSLPFLPLPVPRGVKR